jgi:hypothetical protein
MKLLLIFALLFSVHAKKKVRTKIKGTSTSSRHHRSVAKPHSAAKSVENFDWSREALKLTGESDLSRDQALKALRKHPNIKKILKEQLHTSKRALALDVISALHFRNFIPTLLELAPEDEMGAMYLTINTLLTPKNAVKVIASYRNRLKSETHPASLAVLLDTLGALAVTLPEEQLKAFLKNDSFEVRSAVVSYLRSLVLRHKKRRYANLLKDVLVTSPYQLRIQAIYFASELEGESFASLKEDLHRICTKDYQKPVLKACQEKLSVQ